MSLQSVSTCPICTSTNFDAFLEIKDFNISQENFSVIKCSSCSFLITSPRPDSDSVEKYYESPKYISHIESGKSVFDTLYFLARRLTLQWKLSLIQSYKTNGKILDYGCGTGAFLDLLRKKKWEVTGIEPSTSARIKAEKSLRKKVHTTIDEISADKFDVITLWHVLEHIHELEDTIFKIKALLKEDGTIFIAVPNYESADAQIYKEHWAAYDVPRHLWHFSKDTLKKLLIRHEMKLQDIRPMKLDSFYVSILSEGYNNPRQHRLINATKGIINGLKSNFAASKKMNYSSLIYVVKK